MTNEFDLEQFAEDLAAIPLYDLWRKSMKEKALELAIEGVEIPNFKIVQSTKFRKFCLSDKDNE